MSEPKKRGRPRKNVQDASKNKVPEGMNIENDSGLDNGTVSTVVKKKQVRPNSSENRKIHVPPGVMSKMIAHAVTLQKMGKVDMTNPEAVEKRVDEYLTYCIENDMKPTVESMALAFCTSRTQLWKWKEGVECSNVPDASRQALRRGYDLMNQLLTQCLVDGAINPISAFFLLKNNHNYKDQTEVVVTATNPYSESGSADVRGKYIEGMQTDIPVDGEVK